MSAVKVIFKRSSVLGKRPTGQNLEAGEIGLNTNPYDPGLFFETNDGSVVKVGPTAYLPAEPTATPAKGELWVDSDTKGLNIGTSAGEWQKVAAPFLGGTNGLTVFVAPDYPNATDSLANDGQTVPFITINRAILEVSKNIILQANNGESTGNNRYLIVLAPGRHCVPNGPGASLSNFTVNFSDQYTAVTQAALQQFNAETLGGLIVPRGVSIIGLDLKKCEVHPAYVPHYTHPAFPPGYQQDPNGGPVYENQPLSSIFKWSGNTYLHHFTARDKVLARDIVNVRSTTSSPLAIFKTSQPHGLNYNDFVQVTYTNSADQAGASFSNGAYYVNPVNAFEFQLSAQSWDVATITPVLVTSLPPGFVDSENSPKFKVTNIYPYFVPAAGEDYQLSLYSHHRLSAIKNASVTELNNFYIKVQTAFPNVFGGTVNRNVASLPEYDIVASTNSVYPNNTDSNSTDNSSPYQDAVNHRSNYGMANGDYDGSLVTGFKSVIINSSTAVVLQKDPAAYELYAAGNQEWATLTALSQGARPITSVPIQTQLQKLNEASIPNIRYHYTTIKLENGQSTGLADPNNDFRHFGFRLSGANSFMQAQSTFCIGAAIGTWARDGAVISLTGATTNFGSVAFQAEGFAGIGTLGGANEINKGFLQAGVMRPLALTESQVVSDAQKRNYYLGSKVVGVGLDPADPSVQQIYLTAPFDPATILPFSLKPDTAVWVEDGECSFRGFFVSDGSPTCILTPTVPGQNPYSPAGAILRVRASDSNIPFLTGPGVCLKTPYIRRFVDPRTPSQASYGFWIQSTTTNQAPQLGSVLRLNQTGQNLSTTLKRNYQFDPGQYGGIAQVFTVDNVETFRYNQSVNFNNKISDAAQSVSYTVYATLSDSSTPWVQSVKINGGPLVPFNHPTGSYVTFQNRNYFAAENDLWSTLYYGTTFNSLNGPTKVSPDKGDSPYVTTSVLQNEEHIEDAWQGYVPDPFYSYYTTEIPAASDLTYLRGAVLPYQNFAASLTIDQDDSTVALGILFTKDPVGGQTVTTAESTQVQAAVAMTSPFVASPQRGEPEVISLSLLQVSQITNPKNGLSVVQLTKSAPNPLDAVEYARVIGITSNTITVIRNYYPQYASGTLPVKWPAGTTVKTCLLSCYPEPSVYDSDWAPTKATMLRFYQLMGYANPLIAPYLTPRYAGERLLQNTDLPLSPINGYANTSASWPVEFNNPSTILANNHTWQYAGYFDYSRGLPKYQVNEISRKLQFDYYSTASWGGRLTVVGSDEHGSIVFLGALREALTGDYYNYNTPAQNFNDHITRPTPDVIDNYPAPVLVYSADDISAQFDGVKTSFDLTRGGLPIPISQLSENAMFVTVGGVMQIPSSAYTLATVGGVVIPTITFSGPPPAGASCDVRIVTSDDGEKTLEVLTYGVGGAYDGVQTSFNLSPAQTPINNINSFVYLSGVAQTPTGSGHPSPGYGITRTPVQTTIGYTSAPPAGVPSDVRAILSGASYRSGGFEAVYVIPIDDISVFFDNTKTSFELLVDNIPVNPALVNAENMFVTLGAVIQIPHNVAGNPLSGNTYTVQVNPVTKILEITFAAPPTTGTSCFIRVVASEPKEFIVCPLPPGVIPQPVVAGDGVSVNEAGEIINIDPGLIG